jgi:hypothetical protein
MFWGVTVAGDSVLIPAAIVCEAIKPFPKIAPAPIPNVTTPDKIRVVSFFNRITPSFYFLLRQVHVIKSIFQSNHQLITEL